MVHAYLKICLPMRVPLKYHVISRLTLTHQRPGLRYHNNSLDVHRAIPLNCERKESLYIMRQNRNNLIQR